MTITRADVESLFASAIPGGPIHELCRTWLAVDDAPPARTTRWSDGNITLESIAYIPAGTYKLVCIEQATVPKY